ncbi:unnamed protein product [Ostreobium quekettii]|uniref:Uncharacterized protein n=1 Tax=Ostreobium quekettii TaxID=121088 RepID=A0A8S1IUB2_9CHLO|nr:unnamed protein product [Ostreobium quekettii]
MASREPTIRQHSQNVVVIEVEGTQRISDLDGTERARLFDAIAHAEEQVGQKSVVRIATLGDRLRVVVASEATLPRATFGGWYSPLIDPIERACRSATTIDLLAAFVMQSGVTRASSMLLAALERGARIRILTGDYLTRTQPGALDALLDIASSIGADDENSPRDPATRAGALEVRVVEMTTLGNLPSFHPKAWIIHGEGEANERAHAWVGSSNLSQAALTAGVEWNLRLSRHEDPTGFVAIAHQYDALWERAVRVDRAWVTAYAKRYGKPGLGKTYLAAFDVEAMEQTLGRGARVLFVAHRMELLRQAAKTFRHIFPGRSTGFITGSTQEFGAQLTFASVYSLTRSDRLEALGEIDYMIIDEAHHARASSYINLLESVTARFLLGLTATPERGDGQDILSLFGGEAVFEARLGEGICQGVLVPFEYFGIKDTIDYAPIPWRSGKFPDEELATALATRARMERLMEAWEEHAGTRTLVFCCTIGHADFVSGWLNDHGVRAAAVHSGPESASRDGAIAQLSHGELDALCTVDLFNEGIDIPTLDRVVMLRPTGSRTVFLQQLGRGLRTSPGKESLCVIDFVGNHKIFQERLLLLTGWLRGTPARLSELHDAEALSATLPAGCSIDVELEAIELLEQLVPDASESALLSAYRTWREKSGARPTAVELEEKGGSLSLSLLLTLRALVDNLPEDGDAIARASNLDSERIADVIDKIPALRRSAGGVSFTTVARGDRVVWKAMSLELLDYLMCRRRRLDGELSGEASGFVARVIRNGGGKAILKLPDRKTVEGIPRGEIDVVLDDGEVWVFKFVKIAVNVAYPRGESKNQLDALLRRWFGEAAGARGTTHRVRISCVEDHWTVSPIGVSPRESSETTPFDPGAIFGTEELASMLGIRLDAIDPIVEQPLDDAYSVALVSANDALVRYDLLRGMLSTERAHIFFKSDEGEDRWVYHGEGARDGEREAWRIADVDVDTYKRFGGSRAKSRDLPAHAKQWAKAFTEKLQDTLGEDGVVNARGRTCRVVSVSDRGSVEIEGVGEDGFKPRKVSNTDLAWVLLARDKNTSPILDEATVNRARYLPGTKPSSMRYIDTGTRQYFKVCSEENGVKTDQELVDELVEKRAQLAQLKEEIQEMTTTLAGLSAEVIALEKSVGSRLAALAASLETGQQSMEPRQEALEKSPEDPGAMFQRPWFGEVRALLEEGITSANRERFHMILDMIELDEFKAHYLDYLWQKTSQTTHYHNTSHIIRSSRRAYTIEPSDLSNHGLLYRDINITVPAAHSFPTLVNFLGGVSLESVTLSGDRSSLGPNFLDCVRALGESTIQCDTPFNLKTMRVDMKALGSFATLLTLGLVQTIDHLILEESGRHLGSPYGGYSPEYPDTFSGWSICILSLNEPFLTCLADFNSESVFASVEQLRYSGAFDDRLCDEVARMPSVSEVSFKVIRSEDFKGVARIAGLEHVRQLYIDPQHIEETSSLWEQHPVLGPKLRWTAAEEADT